MKKIQPIQVWTNGQVQSATWLNAYVINDNLKDSATFYYSVNASSDDIDAPGAALSDGNLTMNGDAYQNWNADPDINDAAYQWVATTLGLTII